MNSGSNSICSEKVLSKVLADRWRPALGRIVNGDDKSRAADLKTVLELSTLERLNRTSLWFVD